MTKLSVIIPTTCEAARTESLQKAIGSVLAQGEEVEPIVVVNGWRFDPNQLEVLRRDSSIRLEYLETASPSIARRHGRLVATGEFFAFLDDDDEYLPNALAASTAEIQSDPSVDILVTNGYSGRDARVHLKHIARIRSDPLEAMLEQNWLTSCGVIFRHSSCGDEFFADLPSYMEWTLLAFRLLVAGKRVKVVDFATYRINDTSESASKSREYRRASVGTFEDLLALKLPHTIRRRLRRSLLAAWHDLSVLNLEEGDKTGAWKAHLQSLAGLSGLRYLTYTRRLL
jgi:glycosyltransferase involved in cell wall biosynthesis